MVAPQRAAGKNLNPGKRRGYYRGDVFTAEVAKDTEEGLTLGKAQLP